MTTENEPAADDLAKDSLSFLSPRFAEILDPGECERGPRPSTRRDAGSGVLYRPDVLVTRAEHVDAVARYLDRKRIRYRTMGPLFDEEGRCTEEGRKQRPDRPRTGEPGGGTPRYRSLGNVRGFRLAGDESRERDSLELARLVKAAAADPESEMPADVVAGPLHVLTLAQRPSIGPGSDPLPAAPGEAIPARPDHRTEPSPVGVVDTGLWKDALGWSLVSGDPEDPMPTPGAVVPWRASGHGGFIAWLLQCTAPGCDVRVLNAFTAFDPTDPTSGLTEVSVIEDVNTLVAEGRRIINLSLGSKTDRCLGADLVLLDAAIEDWNRVDDLLIVAAAGNDASPDPWYPAGYAADPRYEAAVVSVGALEEVEDDDGRVPHSRVAGFSNHGPWVTAWAPGVDLVSAYPPGVEFEYTDDLGVVLDTGSFDDGLASWSGTSFATPVVAAQLAAGTAPGDNPRRVWREMRRGRPFAVVWPDWWDTEGKPCIPG